MLTSLGFRSECATFAVTPLRVEQHVEACEESESERASREVLSLPLFPEIEPDELAAVASAIAGFFSA